MPLTASVKAAVTRSGRLVASATASAVRGDQLCDRLRMRVGELGTHDEDGGRVAPPVDHPIGRDDHIGKTAIDQRRSPRLGSERGIEGPSLERGSQVGVADADRTHRAALAVRAKAGLCEQVA